MNTKLHALADANGRSLSFFMTAGQVSDYTGAAALLEDMPSAQWLLGDHATNRSGMTSAVTGVAAASRLCSAASKTGTASPPATIAARSPSSPPSLSLPPSSSGCSQRVLTLDQVMLYAAQQRERQALVDATTPRRALGMFGRGFGS